MRLGNLGPSIRQYQTICVPMTSVCGGSSFLLFFFWRNVCLYLLAIWSRAGIDIEPMSVCMGSSSSSSLLSLFWLCAHLSTTVGGSSSSSWLSFFGSVLICLALHMLLAFIPGRPRQYFTFNPPSCTDTQSINSMHEQYLPQDYDYE